MISVIIFIETIDQLLVMSKYITTNMILYINRTSLHCLYYSVPPPSLQYT